MLIEQIARMISEITSEQIRNLILFLIKWGPTIIFVSIMIISLLLGLWRGAKRSGKLLFRGAILAFILLVFYFVLTGIPQVEAAFYTMVDKACNLIYNKSLVEVMGLSGGAEAETFVDLLTYTITREINYGTLLNSIILDNGAYIRTLASMGYNLYIATLMFLIYFIVQLVFFLVHFIIGLFKLFLPKFRNYDYNEMLTYEDGRKHRIGGMLIGSVRGLAFSTLAIAYIGTLFFVANGGSTTSRLPDLNIASDEVNLYYNASKEITNYGEYGIFSVLNKFKDSDNVPYYVYAFDIIHHGGFTPSDESQGTKNVYLRKELQAYIDFSYKTVDLILKNDENHEIEAFINSNGAGNINDIAMKIITKDSFINEFDDLIDTFEDNDFIFNMALSITNSLVKNANELEMGLSSDVVGLIDTLFVGDDALKLTDLVTVNDIKVILSGLLNIMKVDSMQKEMESKKVVPYIDAILPMINGLSQINNPVYMEKINDTLSSTYSYVLDKLLPNAMNKGVNLKHYVDEADSEYKINWYNELQSLKNIVYDVAYAYDEIITPALGEGEEPNFLNIILDYIFVEPNLNQNKKVYENIVNTLSNSQILAKLFGSEVMYKTINKALAKNEEGKLVFPRKIKFANSFDDEGNFLEYGEIYNFFHLIEVALTGTESKDAIKELLSGKDDIDFLGLISKLKEENPLFETNPLVELSKSELLSYVMTGYINNLSFDASGRSISLRITDRALDKVKEDSFEFVKIKQKNLYQTLLDIPTLLGMLGDIESIDMDKVLELIKNKDIIDLLDNNIVIEGICSGFLIDFLKDNEQIMLTKRLSDFENWIGTDEYDGEIIKLVRTLQSTSIDISSIMDGITLDEIKAWNLKEEDIENLLDSDLLYFTVSNLIITKGGNDIIVPFKAVNDKITDFDSMGKPITPITKEEIKTLFTSVLDMLAGSEINIQSIYNNKDVLLQSSIFEATAIFKVLEMLETNENTKDLISVPKNYKEAGTKEALRLDNNLWFETHELLHTLDALEALFKISDPNFDMENISARINEILNDINEPFDPKGDPTVTNLDVIYLSKIMASTMSIQVEKALVDLADPKALAYYKVDDSYTKDEVKNILTAMEILGIGLDGSGVDNIKSKLPELNNYYDEANKITKLDKIYESHIIALVITKQLHEPLKQYGISRDLDRECRMVAGDLLLEYKKEQIQKVLDAFGKDGLDIDLSADKLDMNINDTINKFIEYENDHRVYKRLTTVYKSELVASLITSQLDKVIAGNKYLETTPKAKEIRMGAMLYKQNEIEALITFLDENREVDEAGNKKDIDLASFSISKLELAKVEDFVKQSLVARASFTEALINRDEFMVPLASLEDGVITLTEAAEVFGLLNDLGFNSISDIKPFNISTVVNHLDSLLVRASVSQQIMNLNKFVIPKNSIELQENHLSIPKKILTEPEIKSIFNFLTDLNITDLGSKIKLVLNKKIMNDIKDSDLLAATLTQQIVSMSGLFVLPKDEASIITTDDYNDRKIQIITDAEFTNIYDFLYDLKKIDKPTNIDESVDLSGKISFKLNDDVINDINKSLILRATISKQLIVLDKLFKIPASVVNYSQNYLNETINVIEAKELKTALTGISKDLGITNLSDLSGITPPKGDITNIKNSLILRATISYLFANNYTINEANNITYEMMAIFGTKSEYAILTGEEIEALMAVIKILSNGEDFNISISRAVLLNNKANIATLLGSELMYVYICDLLSTPGSSGGEVETQKVYGTKSQGKPIKLLSKEKLTKLVENMLI